MLKKPGFGKLINLICLSAAILLASPLHARFKKDCADKASKGSRDYSVMGSVARGSMRSAPYGGITGSSSRYGTSISGLSRGITGSTRNRAAYSMEYQHCMSSFGG